MTLLVLSLWPKSPATNFIRGSFTIFIRISCHYLHKRLQLEQLEKGFYYCTASKKQMKNTYKKAIFIGSHRTIATIIALQKKFSPQQAQPVGFVLNLSLRSWKTNALYFNHAKLIESWRRTNGVSFFVKMKIDWNRG